MYILLFVINSIILDVQQQLANAVDEKIEYVKQIEQLKDDQHKLEDTIFQINQKHQEELQKWSNNLEAIEVYILILYFNQSLLKEKEETIQKLQTELDEKDKYINQLENNLQYIPHLENNIKKLQHQNLLDSKKGAAQYAASLKTLQKEVIGLSKVYYLLYYLYFSLSFLFIIFSYLL